MLRVWEIIIVCCVLCGDAHIRTEAIRKRFVATTHCAIMCAARTAIVCFHVMMVFVWPRKQLFFRICTVGLVFIRVVLLLLELPVVVL